MITFSFETLSPQDALRILREHDEAVAAGEIANRPRKTAAVRRYAADMQADQWNAETAETIKFESGEKQLHGRRLVDGQNRLQACAVSGRNLNVYVARGVAREAFAYIDGGEKRSLRDVLRISGEPDAAPLTTALKWFGRWNTEKRTLTKGSISTPRARKLLESDPAIRRSVVKAKAVKETDLMSVGLAAFLHRIFSRYDSPLADQFVDAIAAGAGLQAGDPFLVLRQRLIENKGSRQKHTQGDIVAMCIKAWNAKREGKSMKIIKLHRNEGFPVLEPTADAQGASEDAPATEVENHASA